MELAIPGVALGLMYIMNGQSNRCNDDEEPFTSRNELPNTIFLTEIFPKNILLERKRLTKHLHFLP